WKKPRYHAFANSTAVVVPDDWAARLIPAVAAAVVEQHAPSVTRAIIAGVRPAEVPIAVGQTRPSLRSRRRRTPRNTASAMPRPTPAAVRTIRITERKGRSSWKYGPPARIAG